jgi:alpha-galactosidase
MKKKIVLVGAGSTSFGPPTLTDLFHSDILGGSTVVLHDINEKNLEIIYELVSTENEYLKNKFQIHYTTNRAKAFENADFIISSIEVGERFKLWRQDYEIPRAFGSTQILGECGGPGGSFHAFRIIPQVVEIVKDAEKICPNAFFINFSNPMARVCLSIKRVAPSLNFVGLCHEVLGMELHLMQMFKKNIKDLKLIVGGLNHFAFLFGLEDLKTGNNLMPEFNSRVMDYFKINEDRFDFSSLTFEIYKRFGWFCYGGDNHVGEYLQFSKELTNTQDMIDWIDRTEKRGKIIYQRTMKYYNKLKEGRFPKKGMHRKEFSGERAIPIIESIIENRNSYESAVNIPNYGIIDNLPQDLVVECSGIVNRKGIHGIKLGNIPKSIAGILRIEATIQDLCVEAVLKNSKELAIACLAIDPNVGSFETAENIFNKMLELQKEYLPKFK